MQTTYTVSGMTCGHCAMSVTEEVAEVTGVKDVNVNHETGAMIVESDERIPFDSIINAVAEAGNYTVVEA